MNCTTCGADLKAGAKFCSECGTPQTMACSACGAALTPADKFCSECGTPSAAAPAPSQVPPTQAQPATAEERRFVTAMFIDLVGFTPLTESKDSEEVRRMLTVYFDRAREIVDRFGGVIDKYIGDAVMAVWGAHTAHEDDAERAVRAAMELVESVGQIGAEVGIPTLQARAGVLSGEAIVGGDGNAVTGLIIGDTVNTASRLQGAATPGTVLVGRSTKDLSVKAVEFEAAGSFDLKGKEGLTEAWRAVRVLGGHGGSRRSEGLVPPYVGRTDELRMLKDNLHSAARDGRLRVVSVVGQGGIGKSRLVDEFWNYLDGLSDVTYWHHGRSLAYGEHAGFWAIGEMVRQRCGITEGEDEHKTRTRLRTTLAELIPDADDRAWMEPKLENLLGISDAQSDRSELFAAWRMLFLRIADIAPVVMVFEDLHWADDGVLEFIDDLVAVGSEAPILVVTLARPELLERRPGWGSGRANSLSIHLAPLADPTMRSLLLGLVPDAPDVLVGALVERAGGIPLYAVEMMRMLIDRGTVEPDGSGAYRLVGDASEVEIPDSLHGLVGARLDQFDADLRALIADAAILGQSFTITALQGLRNQPEDELRAQLEPLVHKEVLSLNRDPRSPERGQYQFVQSIIREVAHERISRTDRLRLHQKVAEFFESTGDAELTGIAASHYLDALEVAGDGPEADALRPKVIESLLAAADRADLLGSFAQVVSLCQRGVALTEDPAMRGELLVRGARAAHSALDESARQMATDAMAEFESAGDDVGRIRAATVYAKLLDDVGEAQDAWPVLLEALEASPGETQDHVRAMSELARAYMLDRQSAGLDWIEKALELAERFDMVPTIVELWATKGAALSLPGRIREGLVLLEAALELAREHQLTATKRRVMANIGYLSTVDGIAEREGFIEERLEDARRLGDARLLAEALLAKAGNALTWLNWDEFEAAMAQLDRDALDADIRDSYDEELANRQRICGDPSGAAAADEARWAGKTGDSQVEGLRGLSRATNAFYLGRYEEVVSRSLDLDLTIPGSFDLIWAVIGGLRVRDVNALRLASDRLAARPYRGVGVDVIATMAEAGIAMLEGERDKGRALFTKAVEIGPVAWGPLYGNLVVAEGASYLGPGDPTASEWARAVHDIWTKAGLTTLLDLYADAFVGLDDQAAESA